MVVRYVILAFVFCVWVYDGCAQFQTSSPSVSKQEYFNPAYNAYKGHHSLNLIYRNQWIGIKHSPKLAGLNMYKPVGVKGLGLGANIISEDIGLRNKKSLQLSISKGVRVGYSMYFALGLSLGVENERYNREDFRLYPGVDISRIDMNSNSPILSLGFMGMATKYFFGFSSVLSVNESDINYKYLKGFDLLVGRIFEIDRDFVFRTTLTGKYYKNNRYSIVNKRIESKFLPPVADFTTSCFMYEKVWVSAGYRLNQAVTMSVVARMDSWLSLGVKYEKGVGDGLNAFNSSSVYVTYNFIKKRRRFTSIRRSGVFESGFYRYNRPLNYYLY
jgi:type IX secretion system PorP/SprF family membrane protein